jgi:hypothetical protein
VYGGHRLSGSRGRSLQKEGERNPASKGQSRERRGIPAPQGAHQEKADEQGEFPHPLRQADRSTPSCADTNATTSVSSPTS